MMSTQKLIILLILINLVIGISGEIWKNPTGATTQKLVEVQQNYEQTETSFSTDQALWGGVKAPSQLQTENTIGNKVVWSEISFYSVLANGFYPFSFKPKDFPTLLEQTLALILIIFRCIIMAIVVLEISLLVINKKAT